MHDKKNIFLAMSTFVDMDDKEDSFGLSVEEKYIC
jgi:hypothetical protein